MSLNWAKSSPNSVPEYQLSGVPFVTSSADGTTVASGQVPAGDLPLDSTPAQIRLAHQVAPYKVSFPFVTRWVQITNIGSSDLRCGFTANGVRGCGEAVAGATGGSGFLGQNYFIVPNAAAGDQTSTMRLELRCTDMYFLGAGGVTDVSVVAGLTSVHREQFPALTGSTYTEATNVQRRSQYTGKMETVQIQSPLFATGSSGLG